MTRNELDEIGDLRRYLNKVLMWGAGAVLTVGLAAFSYAVKQQADLTQAQTNATAAMAAAATNQTDIKALNAKISDMTGALSGLQSEMRGQRRTLDRIDASIAEIIRYLRPPN